MRHNQRNSVKGKEKNGREPERRNHRYFAESFEKSEKIDKAIVAHIFCMCNISIILDLLIY